MEISNVPAPTPMRGPWSRRRGLTLGLTALALVAGGGVAIGAGNPDPTNPERTEARTASALPVPDKAIAGLGGVLHSESVVSNGDGGYLTHLTQRGTIESIDSDRLTVVSEDGYERTWNRTADTVTGGSGWSVSKNDDGSYTVKKDTGELAAGDQVVVVGTVRGEVATAERIASRPDTGEIPGQVLKRFDGEFGGKADELMRGDRLMKRFERPDKLLVPGPGGSGPEVHRYEFRTPDEKIAPAPEPAAPAEPGWDVDSAPAA